MAITKEQIFEIANALDAEGHNPTLSAVRKQLGGGSFTTISDAMTEWRARKAEKGGLRHEAPPAVVIEQLNALGVEVWTVALELANGRLSGEREALEAARVQLGAEKAEAAELADDLNQELEQEKRRALSLEQAHTDARQELARLQTQYAGVLERATTGETRVIEIERRASDLNAELLRVHQQNDDLLKSLSALTAALSGAGERQAATGAVAAPPSKADTKASK